MKYINDLNFRKNFLWNVVGTSLNAFNSLFFMIIVTRINGLNDSGIFTLAFSLACLLCIIGGYEGRVFQVTDIKKEFNDKEYIIHRFLTTILMMIIAFLYTRLQNYNFEKTLITLLLCLMKGLEVIADVFYGILQKNNYLYKVGISLTIKSIFSVICFFVIDKTTNSLILSCLTLVIVWLIILIVYDIVNSVILIDKKEKINKKNILLLFKSGFFAFSILFLSMYLINAPKYALDGRVTEELQAVFGIILMPATVISLCAQYLLQPFLAKMSDSYKKGNRNMFKKVVNLILIIIILIGVFAFGACWVIGIPILNIIYNVKLDGYRTHLLIIIIGAVLYSLGTLYSTALTTIRKTFIQFIIYVSSSIFGLIISIILIEKYALLGAALAYFSIMVFQFILYILYYHLVINKVAFLKCEETI
ncbi:hypothetical protein [uncultured Traorella sp.]|uniref:lipopolysaccharide biosynthesis protein n=1 Tax=uncultured Traorella sp. TaxID=1929048 RepID=UPI0025CD12C0|nr:hypothetical protein [uncultured Traorella sp.]